MTPRDLIAAFEAVADSPDGVARLRELVLQLAVRGKLAHQDASEGSSADYLQQIDDVLTRSDSQHRSAPFEHSPIPRHDEPYVLPPSWGWHEAGHVMAFVTSGSRGWARYYADSGASFLRIGNLDYATRRLDLAVVQHVRPPDTAEATRTRTAHGDILISITGDTGMVGVVPPDLGEAYINQHIALARPALLESAEYLAIAFMSPMGLSQLWDRQRGIKNSLGACAADPPSRRDRPLRGSGGGLAVVRGYVRGADAAATDAPEVSSKPSCCPSASSSRPCTPDSIRLARSRSRVGGTSGSRAPL